MRIAPFLFLYDFSDRGDREMRYFLVDKTVFDNNKVGMSGKLVFMQYCANF